MRIGYLIPEFPGQTHIFYWREAAALRRLGVEVRFFSTRPPPANIVSHEWSQEAIVKTLYLAPMGARELLAGFLGLLRAGPVRVLKCVRAIRSVVDASPWTRLKMLALILPAARLVGMARRSDLPHIHVHSCANAAVIGLCSYLLGGPTYSLTLHGPLSIYGPGQKAKWVHARFGIAVTQLLRSQVLKSIPELPLERVDVAPMGVDLKVFCRKRPHEPPRRGGIYRIVTCGRLHRGKGHQDLIDATAILRRRGAPVELTILGEGPARPDLEAQIHRLNAEPYVRLAGAVSEIAVRNELETAHVFALGSHDEAIGVATMEAMAMALPVVVTDVGGVRELVRHGIDGLLVPPRDPEALARTIRAMHDDPEMSCRMGAAGCERVRSCFSSDVSASVIVRRLGMQSGVVSSQEVVHASA